MPNYAKFNYYNLLNLRPKSFLIILLVTMLSLNILFFINNKHIYDIYYFNAIYNDDYLLIYDKNNNSDTIINSSFIKINNKKYKYKVKNIEIQNNVYVYKLSLNQTINKQESKIELYYPKIRIKEMLKKL
jgi:hypothetical protein